MRMNRLICCLLIRQQIREQEHARDLALHNIEVLKAAEGELLDELDKL